MPRPDIAEHLPINPLRLILGVIACIGIAALGKIAGIACEAGEACVQEVGIEREDDVGF